MVSKNELKIIKSLKVKKYRLREKRFLVEGTKNVLELINSDFEVDVILGAESFFENENGLDSNHRIEVVNSKTLESISSFKSANSCVAVAKVIEFEIDQIEMDKQLFVLDGVNDPGNLGTIIRTLDWFGFNQMVCSENTADFYNPKVINSTMGSFSRMKIVYTDLPTFLDEYKYAVYGAEMEGTNLFDTNIDHPSIIAMGSESHGLSTDVKSKLSESITIPKYGSAESLNVGVATGIIASYLRLS